MLGEVFIAVGRRVCVEGGGVGGGGGGGSGTKGEEEGEEEGGEGGGASLYTYHKLTNRNASGIAR